MKLNYALIGQRVAAQRKHLKLTQAQLAEKSELTTKYISKIETSNSIPSIQSVMKLCAALELTPNYLLFEMENDIEQQGYTETAHKLKLCSPSQIRQISGFIDVILDKTSDGH